MNILSWIFSAIIIYSVVLIGNKNRWGWMIANIGAIGFIYLYVKTGLWGGIALDLFLLVMNTINFIKWTKDNRLKRPFHLKFQANHPFKLNDLIKADASNDLFIIIDVDVKDKIWKKILRTLKMRTFLFLFGLDISDYTGCIKVKPQLKHT